MGSVVALSIVPEQGETSPVPEWLQRVNFNLTYSWLKDTTGHFAVKISYETGQVGETGQDVRATKVGLAAKFWEGSTFERGLLHPAMRVAEYDVLHTSPNILGWNDARRRSCARWAW
jgi:hypothetical protein